MEVVLDVDDRAARATLRGILRRGARPVAALRTIGLAWEASVQANFNAGGRPEKWKPKKSGEPSHLQDSGSLQRSITHRILPDGVQVGTSDRKARLHQFGGTVRPRRGKFLAIPLVHDTRTRAGARALSRRFPGRTFVHRGRKGGLVVMWKRADESVEPLFVLRRQVTMPARPFLVLQEQDRVQFKTIITTYLRLGIA